MAQAEIGDFVVSGWGEYDVLWFYVAEENPVFSTVMHAAADVESYFSDLFLTH
jgi:hypothetical protein